MLYSPTFTIFHESPAGASIIGWFVASMFGACMVVSLGFVIRSSRCRSWQPGAILLAFAVALYVLGSVVFFFLMELEISQPLVALVAGLCTGAGAVPVCVAWGRQLVTDLRSAVLLIAVASIAASLLSWGMTMLPTVATYIVFPFLVLIGSLMSLLGQGAEIPEERGASDASADASLREPMQLIRSLRQLASVVWLPALGLLLFAFMMSVRKLSLFNSVESEFVGGILSGVLVILLSLTRPDRPMLSFVYKVVIPIGAGVIIILNSLPSEGPAGAMASVALYVFLAFMAVFALASIIGTAHAEEFTQPFLFGVALFLGSFVSAVGLGMARLLPDFDAATSLLPVLLAVLLAGILISLGLEAWRALSTPQAIPAGASSLQESLELRCDVISRKFRLSARESEILCYLGRGYGPAYVAKTLLISESTARSHIRNIYAKIGVSSREELFGLIDREEDTGCVSGG